MKNLNRTSIIGGRNTPFMHGKFVSEAFKELHSSKKESKQNVWSAYKEQFRSEARWHKAFQHLRDDGLIIDEPKDIGAIIKEVMRDIEEECGDDIKAKMWDIFSKDLFKTAIYGLPEWYKRKLLEDM